MGDQSMQYILPLVAAGVTSRAMQGQNSYGSSNLGTNTYADTASIPSITGGASGLGVDPDTLQIGSDSSLGTLGGGSDIGSALGLGGGLGGAQGGAGAQGGGLGGILGGLMGGGEKGGTAGGLPMWLASGLSALGKIAQDKQQFDQQAALTAMRRQAPEFHSEGGKTTPPALGSPLVVGSTSPVERYASIVRGLV